MLRLLRAMSDRLVPDEAPGNDASAYVARRLAACSADEQRSFWLGLTALDAEAMARCGTDFAGLRGDAQDGVLRAVEAGETRARWPVEPARWFERALSWLVEATYADAENPSVSGAWDAMGYASAPIGLAPRRALPAARLDEDYDVVVIGAGVAGSIVAAVLGAAGRRVLVLERGDDATERALRRDHLANHRLSLYGHNTGPDLDGFPRVLVPPGGAPERTRPHEGGYHNNAMCLGGGGLVYGGMAWRFAEEDFRMASAYGVPEGSSLADWPMDYAALEPYYEKAEWEVGVAGGATNAARAPRRRGYPMPPLPGHPGRRALARGAEALGFSTHGVPLLVNSVARAGRAACARCNACVGFACPVDAKNGGHHLLFEPGLASGNVTLVTEALAARIETDPRGEASGVVYHHGPALERRVARARHVVVAAGAIESARLLLLSGSEREPSGLGNAHDQVGRHLQGHVYATATALMSEPVEDGRGPGPSIATSAFNHGNPGVIGGGLLSDDFVLLPVVAWRQHLPPDVPRWGRANRDFLRDDYRRILKITGPVQEIPSADCRVTLDPHVRDRAGLPVARLSGAIHAETARSAAFLRRRAEDWLHASGARAVFGGRDPSPTFLSAGQHQAGTCRMGRDPRSSVTDSFGRVHGHSHLSVIDASLHVTNGGYNPALTVMALAFRCAEALAREL